MTVSRHKRWFLLSLNFAFVSWGVLFNIGMMHGIFRQQLQSPTSVRIIFGAATILHAVALLLVFTSLYNGAAFIIRRLFADGRARRRIEQMQSESGAITDAERARVFEEEYTTERRRRKPTAQPA